MRADLAALAGEPGSIAEICGVGPIPPSALGRLTCNSDVWIEIFGDNLTPLYETVASRAPTAAQRRALIARDEACIGCGEPPGECEAHHITPCQRGGKTRLDNLVLVCWHCHDLIHDHNWQVIVRSGRYRLAPPDPAHPAKPAPQRKPRRQAAQPRTQRCSPQREPEHRSPQPDGERDSQQQVPTASGLPPTPPATRPLWEDPAA
ncbi:MAG: HNH endonuclease [Acidimicrobiaceae bacterium]|nr:HNH endonuclease [Acidimicrobiaceae bacterium]